MKLESCIINAPDTGVCTIDVDKIARWWQKNSFISRWHDDYRICSGTKNKQIKFTISEADAKALIEKLGLVQVAIKPFACAWSYMTKERKVRYDAAMRVPDLVMEIMQLMMQHKMDLSAKEQKKYFKGVKDMVKTMSKRTY